MAISLVGKALAIFDTNAVEGRIVEFKPFPKIPRLRRDCIITEKLDGTNALVFVHESGQVIAGSRTRWILPDAAGGKGSDNMGFAAWVAEHEDELRQLGPGYHYGEWYGRGIQRGYGLPDRRFALFNVRRWYDITNSELASVVGSETPPACCEVVRVLHAGLFFDAATDKAIADLRAFGSFHVPGFKQPEGVVVFHAASGQVFKVLCDLDDKPKGA